MAIITSTILPSSALNAPPSTSSVVLQAGQVVTAQVVEVLSSEHVQIAISNQTIDATTQVPLQAGQTLQLQVSQTASGVALAIVNSPPSQQAGTAGSSEPVTLSPTLAASVAANLTSNPITPANPLTPIETLAVSLAAQAAATQQTSLAPLFADLNAASGLPNLPPSVQQAAAQVLARQIPLDQNLTGEAVSRAFQSSGLFLEASLASGATPSADGTPNLKAALLVLRQVLATSLAGVNGASNPTNPAPAVTQAVSSANVAQLLVSSDANSPAAVAASVAVGAESAPGSAGAAEQISAALTSALAAQVSAEVLAAPVTILAEPAAVTPASEPAATAPALAPGAGSPAAPAPGAATAIAAEITDSAALTLALAPATLPADAAARATATSAALNVLQEVFQAAPVAASAVSNLVLQHGELLSLLPVVPPVRAPAIDDPEFAHTNLPPPPVYGALPSAQAVAPATLAPHMPLATALQHLLGQTDGAIARQTLLQIASLPGQTDPSAARIDPGGPRWNFEIPFATPQGTAIAQFEISRDGGGREATAAKATWRARFSLDVEPAGPVHALISLNGDRTSVRMWAERPATASQLRAGVSQLTQALSRAELTPGDIVVRDGAPTQASPALAGHFLDRAS